MTIERLKIGTDTELFLRDIVTKVPVPVCGLLGGTKRKPRLLPELGDGFAVQEDNVMVEFNLPPTKGFADFHMNTYRMMQYLKEYFLPMGLEVFAAPSCRFAPEQLTSKQAMQFGCEPDFDAWELAENEIDRSDPDLATLRTAGGHIHISFTENGEAPSLEAKLRLVKALDIFCGVPSLSADTDTERRKLYGKAGAFRPKPYGIEYRALSNFWIANQNTLDWMWTAVNLAVSAANHVNADSDFEIAREDVLAAINNSDSNKYWDIEARFGFYAAPNQSREEQSIIAW